MKIGGLQKTTLIDYPGKVACTVFLIGCNFRCPWCYSPELVLPEKIKNQPRISEKEFFEFLESRQGLLDGCVLCGGEPTIHKNLPDFIKKIKKLGYSVKLDTNGSNPALLKKLIDKKLIDYVAMDIKQTQNSKFKSQKYDKATGVKTDLNKIKKSVEILKNSNIDFEFRTTVALGINTKEDIIEIAKWIGGPKVKYYLQNFLPQKTLDAKFEKIKPYSFEYLKEIQREVAPFFKICQLR
ncbi:anaerobic ribonucleoside-triphosphate reductase activating protein [bacterium (Candidatus Gribaldobacteria) CG07_land_8_20_14_0_80_33_18]|uniref:Anaerobic ribonucleoside-triphosphate reductase activating protein n=1 Tax=bacterium (Candidatus Gribaldobacteria) CG07_land_8_20_14_0_80_33_18 TaxID=2014272 RepID=A0A2M6Z2M6_9BACT|nr:MAG: anaerobic ribonucleoside-triphosphate reductase activating protein [bacterium (Candidatus Gribaldobacteria) CG10_big_fil_rev_8_21_14_0_10_33_41]PIU46636.1 MAG: anaerobic ribonucleoside-triphosphate reductase activating protein [bacterium (Candidatus Gribaldobacteria) CG07_land_8_20_14_0_80_33_18]PJA00931.1 MAG: anaerobic ribonucleoside-triphosphate reductase activating protein [bacterium (Candidatus Gribaldobacteria) CG_4_10_14_0_2_um_filter_33_15]